MKKIAISLIALAALSTASFASYRDDVIYVGPDTNQMSNESTGANAMVVIKNERQRRRLGPRRQQPPLIVPHNKCAGRAIKPGHLHLCAINP